MISVTGPVHADELTAAPPTQNLQHAARHAQQIDLQSGPQNTNTDTDPEGGEVWAEGGEEDEGHVWQTGMPEDAELSTDAEAQHGAVLTTHGGAGVQEAAAAAEGGGGWQVAVTLCGARHLPNVDGMLRSGRIFSTTNT